jgi:hypothetical protein
MRQNPVGDPVATAALNFGTLLASGQINKRKVDGWQTLATMRTVYVPGA